MIGINWPVFGLVLAAQILVYIISNGWEWFLAWATKDHAK